jgi:hypothetical protein
MSADKDSFVYLDLSDYFILVHLSETFDGNFGQGVAKV